MSDHKEETFSSTEINNSELVINDQTDNIQPVIAVENNGNEIVVINQRINDLEVRIDTKFDEMRNDVRNDMARMRNDMRNDMFIINDTLRDMMALLTQNQNNYNQVNRSLEENKLSNEEGFRQVHDRMDVI